MKNARQTLYEPIRHKSEDLPLKIYYTTGVYLHWHDEYEFVMVEKGNALCVINGETIELTENEALLLHSGDLHSIHGDTNAKIIAIIWNTVLSLPQMFAAMTFPPEL